MKAPDGLTVRAVLVALLAFGPAGFLSPAPGRACTSLVLDNGFPVFATNYDSDKSLCLIFFNKRGTKKVGLSAGISGEYARWTARYASITFNAGGYQLPWAGMNEKGLVLSTMALSETDPPDPDERLPLEYGPLWMQYVLDTCATIDEVVAADARVRHVNTVDHYLVVDRSGTGAVVELLDGETIVYTGVDLPVTALTNSTYAESGSAWLMHRQAEDHDYSDLDSSLRRFCLVADQVAAFRPGETDSAVGYAFETLEIVTDHSTQWSIVFDTADLRAYYKTLTNREVRYLDLSCYDPLCNTPVQMVDIHSPPAGNIVDYLSDLSLPACRDHLQRYLIASGTVVPQELLDAMFQVLETYTCLDHRRASRRVR